MWGPSAVYSRTRSVCSQVHRSSGYASAEIVAVPAGPGRAPDCCSGCIGLHDRASTASASSCRTPRATVSGLYDVIARHGLHFHQARQSGIVFHMISSLTERGRVGLTAVGATRAQAQSLYERAERILLDESTAALREGPIQI